MYRHSPISTLTRVGLNIQGYRKFSDQQLASFRFGIRIAYLVGPILVLAGLTLQNLSFYYAALPISLAGMFLPRHPVDYIYNTIVRHLIKRPALPRRPPQSRFKCSMATIWISAIIVTITGGYEIAAAAMAGAMVMQAAIVSTVDVCFHSMIYNFITR